MEGESTMERKEEMVCERGKERGWSAASSFIGGREENKSILARERKRCISRRKGHSVSVHT